MLTKSFCCFRGVGEAAERRLWQEGCTDWDVLSRWPVPLFSSRKWDDLKSQIDEAKLALEGRSADYFLRRLKGVHKARLMPDFANDLVFVDIETTGLESDAKITTIGVRRNGRTSVFVSGKNLPSFLSAVRPDAILVTFNGTSFDLPILRKHFQMDLQQSHLDLRYILQAMGCRGGQKAAERTLNMEVRESKCRDGVEAVRLWENYEATGNKQHLQALIQYNADDVLMLEKLLQKAYRHSMAGHPQPLL